MSQIKTRNQTETSASCPWTKLPVKSKKMNSVNISTLARGAYTLPDASRLLGISLSRVRSWINGAVPLDEESIRDKGKDRTFSFYTLIELFTVATLRECGVSLHTLRKVRSELIERFDTAHPFALKGLLTDGRHLLKELGDASLLELGTGGQTAFEKVIAPFCQRLDFDSVTKLASRFYPNGRESNVVVDPKHAFGRPVIIGSNITTEALACLVRGGEKVEDVAEDFRINEKQVIEAWEFEERLAA